MLKPSVEEEDEEMAEGGDESADSSKFKKSNLSLFYTIFSVLGILDRIIKMKIQLMLSG